MEEKRQEEVDLIQWHPTFFADVQVELRKESEKLSFQSEYQLSKKPMEIDVLIIKKKTEEPIEKNIGRIFRAKLGKYGEKFCKRLEMKRNI